MGYHPYHSGSPMHCLDIDTFSDAWEHPDNPKTQIEQTVDGLAQRCHWS
jgi:hypothetical protein